MTRTDTFFGLSAALTTPFQADGGVDHDRMTRHAAWVVANGCDGFTLFGTTGEGYGLSVAERAGVFMALAEAGLSFEEVHAGVVSSAGCKTITRPMPQS